MSGPCPALLVRLRLALLSRIWLFGLAVLFLDASVLNRAYLTDGINDAASQDTTGTLSQAWQSLVVVSGLAEFDQWLLTVYATIVEFGQVVRHGALSLVFLCS